MLMFNRL